MTTLQHPRLGPTHNFPHPTYGLRKRGRFASNLWSLSHMSRRGSRGQGCGSGIRDRRRMPGVMVSLRYLSVGRARRSWGCVFWNGSSLALHDCLFFFLFFGCSSWRTCHVSQSARSLHGRPGGDAFTKHEHNSPSFPHQFRGSSPFLRRPPPTFRGLTLLQ